MHNLLIYLYKFKALMNLLSQGYLVIDGKENEALTDDGKGN